MEGWGGTDFPERDRESPHDGDVPASAEHATGYPVAPNLDYLASLLALADDCFDERAPKVIACLPHFFRIVTEGRGKEHCGDCTNVPATCDRCLYEEYQAKAAIVLEGLLHRAPITGE